MENKKEESKGKPKQSGLYEEIEIPGGVEVSVNEDFIIVKKEDRELKRNLISLISVKVEGNKIIVVAKKNRKIEKMLFGTIRAHIKNMIKGMDEEFKYVLKIANVHFPMNVSYDKSKNQVVIKNFLGEKKDRIIQLGENVDVKVDKEEVIVTSFDIERAGDAATKIEKGAKVTNNRDRRIFQDGIFISEKPGRSYS